MAIPKNLYWFWWSKCLGSVICCIICFSRSKLWSSLSLNQLYFVTFTLLLLYLVSWLKWKSNFIYHMCVLSCTATVLFWIQTPRALNQQISVAAWVGFNVTVQCSNPLTWRTVTLQWEVFSLCQWKREVLLTERHNMYLYVGEVVHLQAPLCEWVNAWGATFGKCYWYPSANGKKSRASIFPFFFFWQVQA